jgi:hypothetical protein
MNSFKRETTELLSSLHAWLFGTLKVRFVEELSNSPKAQTLYVLGEAVPWSAALLCPCRCGAVIQLSLLKDDSPRWTISVGFLGLPTLAPSVWRTAECRSHFFLRRGKIVWCGRHSRMGLNPLNQGRPSA